MASQPREIVPTYRPTAAQMEKGLAHFVASVYDDALGQAGIMKIVPPAGWLESKGALQQISDEVLAQQLVGAPIRQYVEGRRGCLQLRLVDCEPIDGWSFKLEAEDPENAPPDELSVDELEQKFWRLANSSAPAPVYGADCPGSLFNKAAACPWDPDRLDSVLSVLGKDLPGVTRAMLYFGTWRSMFGWHKEDMDLFSVNYLHCGEPKLWYAIPVAQTPRFESFANSLWSDLHLECPEFLRHKTSFISPKVLAANAIPFGRAVQYPGEFMVTLPKAYHAGFNLGFNLAESSNFATPEWIPIGMRAKVCQCQEGNVFINMSEVCERWDKKQAGLKYLPEDEEAAMIKAAVKDQGSGPACSGAAVAVALAVG
eukprot:g6325.t1